MADGDKSIPADSKIMLLSPANPVPGCNPVQSGLDLLRGRTELSMTRSK